MRVDRPQDKENPRLVCSYLIISGLLHDAGTRCFMGSYALYYVGQLFILTAEIHPISIISDTGLLPYLHIQQIRLPHPVSVGFRGVRRLR